MRVTTVLRAFAATTLVVSFAAMGCSVQAAEEPTAVDDPTAANLPTSEGPVGQTQQALNACANDVPSSGFLTFPYNEADYAVNSGWKPGCVSFYVNRNVNTSQSYQFGAEEWAEADFPQFEGNWTPAKQEQCERSYVDVWFADKPAANGSYPNERSYRRTATVALEYDASSPSLLRIKSCTATVSRGLGCVWFPANNFHRIDVKQVVNGNPSTPIGPARVHAHFENDSHC